MMQEGRDSWLEAGQRWVRSRCRTNRSMTPSSEMGDCILNRSDPGGAASDVDLDSLQVCVLNFY